MTSNDQHTPTTDRVDLALASNTCPNCGKPILPMQAIGTGDLADGRFCSFTCLVQFNPYVVDSGAHELRVAGTRQAHE